MNDNRLSTTFAWIQVIRLPILLTAPGSVIAGYALVSNGFENLRPVALLLGVMASLCAMAGGTLINAWRDRHVDELDHPERPIPSGLIQQGTVLAAGIACLVVVLLCTIILSMGVGILGMAMCALALLHALVLRRVPVLGPLSAGMLYVLPLLLGVALASDMGNPQMVFVWLAAALLVVYAAGNVALWKRTTTNRLPSKAVLIILATTPLTILLSGLKGILGGGWTCIGLWLIWLIFVYTTIHLIRALWRVSLPEKAHEPLGYLLRNLILMQSYWVAASGASCYMVASVLLLWPLAGFLNRQLR